MVQGISALGALNLPVDSINLDLYSVADLLRLRDRVNRRLPSANIRSLDLNEELVRTYQLAKELLEDAKDDDDVPLSQKATITNSLNSIIKQLADTQQSLLSVENQQKLERALTAALKKFPELQEAFLSELESH